MGIIDQYGEGYVAQKLGPNWRQQRRGVELQNEQQEITLEGLRADMAAVKQLHAEGKIDAPSFKAAQFLAEQKLRELTMKGTQSLIENRDADTALTQDKLINPERHRAQVGIQPVNLTDMDGNDVVVDKRTGEAIPGYGPARTADQKNAERYDVVVPSTIDMLQTNLDKIKGLQKENWFPGQGMVAGILPGTDSYRAKENYKRLLIGMAATLGRAQGDNRITDADRPVYADMAGVANMLVMTDAGSELAQDLLDQLKIMHTKLSTARKQAQRPQGANAVSPPGGGLPPAPSEAIPEPTAEAPQVMRQKKTVAGVVTYRHSLDGGATWQPGYGPQ